MKRVGIIILFIISLVVSAPAQQYDGMSGLMFVPSADMDPGGSLRLGTNFLNAHALPNNSAWYFKGEKYNTANFSLSVTPFEWVQVGIVFTLFKLHLNNHGFPKEGYIGKDRHFNIKIRPLKEGKYYPSVAVGMNDFISSKVLENIEKRWGNWFITATKHFDFGNHRLGATLTYRHYFERYNRQWNGLVGGLTYAPPVKGLQVLAEWTGSTFNLGAQYTLWKQLRFQGCLINCQYPCAGVCWIPDLL